MYSSLKKVLGILAMVAVTLVITACDGDSSASQKERETQKNNYSGLVEKEPAKEVTNPITRKTVNFWAETWNKKDQLAYVYLQNSDGDMIGYYVLDGPPIPADTMLTPNYEIKGHGDSKVSVPAPGMDGVYRPEGSGSDTYYGKDATNGSFVQFSVGMGINMLLYTEPLPNHPNVENLAPVSKDDAEEFEEKESDGR